MPDATIIIPIGPNHMQVAARAIDSAERQTWPTTVITAFDERGHGPGRARNMALQMVRTNWVVFLDADDWIEPNYVARTLQAWKAGHYVYTDWWEGDVHHSAPACPWINNEWHVLTSLMPTNAARAVEFDESLPGAEDKDFYMGLTRGGTCGIHLNEPLFHYGNEGTRARDFIKNSVYDATLMRIDKKHKGKPMGCCGDIGSGIVTNNPGEREPGDVEVVAKWGGNRPILGPITGRNYPRTGNNKRFWCHPDDAATLAGRNLVMPVKRDEVKLIKPVSGVLELSRAMFGNTIDTNRFEVPGVEIAPDVGRVLELYRKAVE